MFVLPPTWVHVKIVSFSLIDALSWWFGAFILYIEERVQSIQTTNLSGYLKKSGGPFGLPKASGYLSPQTTISHMEPTNYPNRVSSMATGSFRAFRHHPQELPFLQVPCSPSHSNADRSHVGELPPAGPAGRTAPSSPPLNLLDRGPPGRRNKMQVHKPAVPGVFEYWQALGFYAQMPSG